MEIGFGGFTDITWANYVIGIFVSLGAWCFFLWSLRDGQFKEPEEAKNRMLENDRYD
ncbi:MAG TPA: cbb3-type cytochrome oxidase assembly protein CcoS [Candidatus Manganitrophaceae bacterium]|nr:cbb3-type cytochrome oxidase assembly protein CcoS [Candidatus Manganitrophaceae bacterium]